MMQTLEIKKGDQLVIDVTRTDPSGSPVDLTGQTITSWVKLQQLGFSAQLTVAPVNLALGQFRLSATSAQTALWPVGTLVTDVKYDAGSGQVRRSRTYAIKVDDVVSP